jgi:hypothetical protein
VGYLEGKRRKKMLPDPNTAFARVKHIRKAQVSVGRVIEESDDPEASDEDIEVADCIIVDSN